MAATAIGLIFLFLVLYALLRNGIPALSGDLFTQTTPPPGSTGGLANAIYGSVVMTVVATLVGTPIGVLTGTYPRRIRPRQPPRPGGALRQRHPAVARRRSSSACSSIRSWWCRWAISRPGPAASALAIIVVPVVVRTTEDMLELVPASLREAASALGTPQWRVIVQVIYRAALQGMLTGVMLAVARIAGETAPLLFTALNNQFWIDRHERADGQSAGGDLPVRAEPL